MNLAEKFETLECARDDKARRVANVAPDTVANITPDELEAGVTLERLETIGVPVLRYSTQITIHGKIAAFNPEARPGGYKAIFRNQNGSVGVRYSAIDGPKKELIERCADAATPLRSFAIIPNTEAAGGWHVIRNSTAFYVSRNFYVTIRDSQFDPESVAAQKTAALAALRAIPRDRYYGSAFGYVLAYGAGYGVAAEIGAIPAADFWLLCAHFFGIANLAELEAKEAIKAAGRAQLRAEREAADAVAAAERARLTAERAARFAVFRAAITHCDGRAVRVLEKVPRASGAKFIRFRADRENPQKPGEFLPVRIELEKRGASLCFCTSDRGEQSAFARSKWAAVRPAKWEAWERAAAAGELFTEGEPPRDAANAERSTRNAQRSTGGTASTSTSTKTSAERDGEAATSRQTFALFCATGKDWRNAPGLTFGTASAAIAAVQFLRERKDKGAKAEAREIVESILSGTTAAAVAS